MLRLTNHPTIELKINLTPHFSILQSTTGVQQFPDLDGLIESSVKIVEGAFNQVFWNSSTVNVSVVSSFEQNYHSPRTQIFWNLMSLHNQLSLLMKGENTSLTEILLKESPYVFFSAEHFFTMFVRNLCFRLDINWKTNSQNIKERIAGLRLKSIPLDLDEIEEILKSIQFFNNQVDRTILTQEFIKVINEISYYTLNGMVHGLTLSMGEEISVVHPTALFIRNLGEQGRKKLQGSLVNPLGITDIMYNSGANPHIEEAKYKSPNNPIMLYGIPFLDEPQS